MDARICEECKGTVADLSRETRHGLVQRRERRNTKFMSSTEIVLEETLAHLPARVVGFAACFVLFSLRRKQATYSG